MAPAYRRLSPHVTLFLRHYTRLRVSLCTGLNRMSTERHLLHTRAKLIQRARSTRRNLGLGALWRRMASCSRRARFSRDSCERSWKRALKSRTMTQRMNTGAAAPRADPKVKQRKDGWSFWKGQVLTGANYPPFPR